MGTLAELFPGNMGRVQLTRVALKLRMPALMTMSPTAVIEPELLQKLITTLADVRKG
jgi:hypothetical protein